MMRPKEESELEKRYKHGLKALAELGDGTSRFLKFRDGILRACEDARKYAKDDDFNEKERKRDAAFLKERKSLVAAARKLSKSFQRYPLQTRATLLHAQLGGRFGNLAGFDLSGTNIQHVDERFDKLLEAYIDTVSKDPYAKKGEFTHRFMVGPLVFQDAIDMHPSKINPSVTGLLFQLVLYMRRFTVGELDPTKISQCEPMPSYGDPRYKIVCDFINDALEKAMDENGARQRLEKLIENNSGIGFTDWPQNIAP